MVYKNTVFTAGDLCGKDFTHSEFVHCIFPKSGLQFINPPKGSRCLQVDGPTPVLRYDDMKQIILASSSIRRQELMQWLGIPFEIFPSDFAEEHVHFADFEDPEDYVATIATGKALVVAQHYPNAIIIASDTAVYLDGKVYGKPKNLDDARRILSALRGHTHTVYTAVVMRDGETGEKRIEVVTSDVTFLKFSNDELEQYIATSEPYDKAGGYALQGFAKCFVQDVQGSAMNVIGFPLITIRDMLENLGVEIEVDIERSIFEKTGYRS